MRLFFAVDFTDAVKNEVQRAIDRITIDTPPWRWVAPANLHMTIKFLGESPEESIASLSRCAEEVVGRFAPFSIRLGGLGGFPDLKKPRVLFYRVEEGGGSLIALAKALDQNLSTRMNILPEKRPFKAHVTVARIKQPIDFRSVDALGSAPPVDAGQEVEKLVLVESRLGPQGAKYYHLKEFALAKPK